MSRENARSPQRRNAVSSRMRAQLLHRLQLMKRPNVVHWPNRPPRFSALYEPIMRYVFLFCSCASTSVVPTICAEALVRLARARRV